MPRINEMETHDLIPIENIHEAEAHSYLRMFMGKVREVYPKCQFSFGNMNHTNIVHVYHDWKPMSMGKIGYGNFRDTGGENNFVVASNRISNGKYQSGSTQYNMKMTKNMDIAVRNAKSFLRDLSSVELANSNGSACRRLWGDTESTSRGNIREKFEQSLSFSKNSDVVIRELQHLVTTGHDFLDAEFSNSVTELLHAHKDHAEVKSSMSLKVVMVSVEQRLSGVCFELAYTEDISEFGAVWHPLGTFSEDTMQAEYSDVAGKLAVLQMCEVGQWVDGVGYKSTPTVHYVTT
jgi:hypothetical protein